MSNFGGSIWGAKPNENNIEQKNTYKAITLQVKFTEGFTLKKEFNDVENAIKWLRDNVDSKE